MNYWYPQTLKDLPNLLFSVCFLEGLIIDKRYEYVGCFVDQENPRALGGYSKDFAETNSPEKCISFCKAKGYLYAGLQYR